MPHIYAESEEAGFFGVGYAQAEGRLQLVLRHQRAVSGTMAEAFGADHLRSDQLARLWCHAAEAEEAFERLSAEVQRDYRALTAGFNREAGPWKSVGVVPAGCAFPVLGHTRHVAWGMTTGAPSIADCYRIEIDPADPHRYRYDGGWKAMSVSEEVIAVRGGEPLRVVFDYTDHTRVTCPVIARHDGFAYAASSPYQHVAELQDEQLRDWNLARGIPEFRDAMRSCGGVGEAARAPRHRVTSPGAAVPAAELGGVEIEATARRPQNISIIQGSEPAKIRSNALTAKGSSVSSRPRRNASAGASQPV